MDSSKCDLEEPGCVDRLCITGMQYTALPTILILLLFNEEEVFHVISFQSILEHFI